MDKFKIISHLRTFSRVGANPIGGGGGGGTTTGGDVKVANEEALKKAQKQAQGFFSAIETSLESLGVKAAEEVLKKFQDIGTKLTSITKYSSMLNKDLGITEARSAKFVEELAKVDDHSGNSVRSFEQLRASVVQMNNFLPGTAGIMQDILRYQIEQGDASGNLINLNATLVNQLGLTAEKANEFSKYQQASGKFTAETVNEMSLMASQLETQTNETGILRDMFKELGAITPRVRLTLKGSATELSKAVLLANRLGTNMDELASSADSMMNIQQSVSAEMEIQQLTGQTLVDDNNNSLTNQMRVARLSNDALGMAEARNKIFEKYGEMLKNPLVAKSLAVALGTDEKSLAAQKEQYDSRKRLMAQLKEIPKEAEEGVFETLDKEFQNLEQLEDILLDPKKAQEFQAKIDKLDSGELKTTLDSYVKTFGGVQTTEENLAEQRQKIVGQLLLISERTEENIANLNEGIRKIAKVDFDKVKTDNPADLVKSLFEEIDRAFKGEVETKTAIEKASSEEIAAMLDQTKAIKDGFENLNMKIGAAGTTQFAIPNWQPPNTQINNTTGNK